MKKLSNTFRLLRKLGFSFSEVEYGSVSLWGVFRDGFKVLFRSIILKICMFSAIIVPFGRLVRPKLWRLIGCKVGKNVFIGEEVYLDVLNTHLIEIEDGVHITNRSFLLCHQRDLRNYYVNTDMAKIGYVKKKITLKKGCFIGIGTIIMPGVTVGEGSIVAAGSVLVKDVPPWCVVGGVPGKVIKKFEKEGI